MRGAEYLSEGFGEGIEEDVLNWELVAFISVQLSAALGFADTDPVCCAVAGTAEAVLFHKGFHEHRLIAITGLPMVWQLFVDTSQDS